MVQKSRHYLYLGLGIGCTVIGIAFLAAGNLFGLLLLGVGLGIIFLSAAGLMKIKFMSRCAEAFAGENFRPDKMVFNGSHFFLCDTEHHTVGYICLDGWLRYVGGEKNLKSELGHSFYLMDSNAITMLRRDESRVRIMFRGLKPIDISFVEKESATELYYALVKVRNENSSFEEAPDRYRFEDEDLETQLEDEDDSDGEGDWDEDVDDGEDDEDEIDSDLFEEDSDETELMGPSDPAPGWQPPVSAPSWTRIFDWENEENFDADLLDENVSEAGSMEAPDPEAVAPSPVERYWQAEDSGAQAPAPESVQEPAGRDEVAGVANAQVSIEESEEPVQKDSPAEPDLRTAPAYEESRSADESGSEGFIPEAQQAQPAVSSVSDASGQASSQTANEESAFVCPRCGSSDLSGETVVTCRSCGHQFFR